VSNSHRINAIIMAAVVLIVSLTVTPIALVGLIVPIVYYWWTARDDQL
jgi:ABC-type Fe3+-siderophore transport system permease subunit